MKARTAALLPFAALAIAVIPQAASAGPPFLTDDPVPTEIGHWEVYGPLVEASGKGRDYEGAVAAEFNYGLAPDVQLTVGLPLSYTHDVDGFTTGRGDLELSLKYRFIHDEVEGVSIAFFPGVTLPTASRGMGAGRATALLPVWAEKDSGPWSVFGGGGYAINPGPGNRDYLTGGLAVTREISDRLLIGVEVARQGADTTASRATTSLGVGAIIHLGGPLRLLGSVGPTYADGEHSPAFHAFMALGIDF